MTVGDLFDKIREYDGKIPRETPLVSVIVVDNVISTSSAIDDISFLSDSDSKSGNLKPIAIEFKSGINVVGSLDMERVVKSYEA